MTHSGQQTIPFDSLTHTVAEYSKDIRYSDMAKCTPFPLKPVTSHSAKDVQNAAQTLSEGNGAILVLSDPVAAAMEISALTRYRLDQSFTSNPEYSRGIALSMMLNSVEIAMRGRLSRDFADEDAEAEKQMRFGMMDSPTGPRFPAQALADRLHRENEVTRSDRADEVWNSAYEKYIDRTKEQAFNEKLTSALAAYNQSIIVPTTRMYLDWLQSSQMKNYFIQHFDPASPHSGARFIQTVVNCLTGMTDKAGVINYLDQQLNQETLIRENYLLRAVFVNSDEWAEKFSAEIKGGDKDWWAKLSWDRLGDTAKEFTREYAGPIQLAMEKLCHLLVAPLTTAAHTLWQGGQVRFAIAMMVMQGRALLIPRVRTDMKAYIRAMTAGAAALMDMSGRSGGRLYSAMRREAELIARDIPPDATIETSLPVAIDIEEIRKLNALPEAERLAKLNAVLLTEYDIVHTIFPSSGRSPLFKGLGMSAESMMKSVTHSGFPLAGGAFSAYFQGWALQNDLREEGWSWEPKALARFGANSLMAWAALMDTLKQLSKVMVRLELPAPVTTAFSWMLRFSELKIWDMFGYGGGMVYALQEVLEGRHDLKEDKDAIGIAHLINGAGVGLLTAAGGKEITLAIPRKILAYYGLSEAAVDESALVTFILGPWGILIGALVVLASGAYLLSQTRNKVQDWLIGTEWRRIPEGEEDIPAIWYNARMEQESYSKLGEEKE